MKRALGKNCVPKYKALEYFYKSNTGLLFATDAHVCLVCRDNQLAPGYYDATYHPVKRGDWVACDVGAMFEEHRCSITPLRNDFISVDKYYYDGKDWLFDVKRVELLKEWLGAGARYYIGSFGTLYGASNDDQRFGLVWHEDKQVYKVGPSIFLTEQEARDFAAMIGVNYV